MNPRREQQKKESLEGNVAVSLKQPDNQSQLSLSEKEKSDRRYMANRGIEEALDQIHKLHEQTIFSLKTISEKVRDLAEMVRELNALSDPPQPDNTICGTIIRLFHEHGITDKNRLIQWALPREYKLYKNNGLPEELEQEQEKERAIKSSLEATVETFILESNKIITEASDKLLELATPDNLEKMSKNQIVELRNKMRDRTEKLGIASKNMKSLQRILSDQLDMYKVKCEQLGVAVDPEAVEAEKDVTSAEPIMSGYSEFWAVTGEFIELWKRIREKIWKYMPLTDQMARDLAEVMRLQIEMDSPLADEKHRADRLQWLLNGANEAYRGKHAAAEMYSYILPKKTIKELKELPEDALANITTPEGMRLVDIALNPEKHIGEVMPDGSILTMEEVPIVREQMGDVKEPLERLAANIVATIPKYTATISWFAHHQGWSIAKRKQEAHPKLSAAA